MIELTFTNLAQTPHQSPVDTHQLLVVDHVGLVEHDPDLVLVPLHRLDAAAELVGDVELVRVEEEQDAIHSLSKPLNNSREIVTTVAPLFLTAELQKRVLS